MNGIFAHRYLNFTGASSACKTFITYLYKTVLDNILKIQRYELSVLRKKLMLQTQETFSYVLLNAAVFPNQNYANTSIMCIECLSI